MEIKKERRRLLVITGLLTVLIMISIAFSISLGAANIDIFDIWEAIFSPDLTLTEHTIIHNVRLPRVLASLLVGACFAVSGAIMQGITRNPLADSGLLGINGGATLAIALCFAFGVQAYNQLLIMSFIGAALATITVFGISSTTKGGATPFRLTLAGAVISALLISLSQGVALYFNLSQDLAYWSAGGMAGITWAQLAMSVPIIFVSLVGSFILAPYLTILSLGDEVATSLGQRTILIRVFSLLIVLMLAGIAVSLAGNVAYVGLIVPHVVKLLVGGKYQFIIPISALLGGWFLLVADLASRLINAPQETPLGALTAMIGVPFFIYLIKTRGRDAL